MRIIVVGAGKVGTSLTAQLIREHRVTVIDQEPKLIEISSMSMTLWASAATEPAMRSRRRRR